MAEEVGHGRTLGVAEERVSKYVDRRAKMQENRQSARG